MKNFINNSIEKISHDRLCFEGKKNVGGINKILKY